MRVLVALLVLLAGCSSGVERSSPGADTDTETTVDTRAARRRVEAVAREVDAWAEAGSLRAARAHAEAAANLIVGPGGLGYGDRDGDGTIGGAVDTGLLPSRDGTERGVVLDTIGAADCVQRDVLGGDWDHPAARWKLLSRAIREWAPDNNTFPDLPSHPMRVVGWATLAQAGSYDEAIEYSSHAGLHVDVTRDALASC